MSENLMEKYRNKPIEPVRTEKVKQGYQTQDGRFIPFLVISYPALNDCLLLVDTDAEAEAMKDAGVIDVIFSRREIEEIKNLPPESIKAHFMIKKTFTKSTIEKG